MLHWPNDVPGAVADCGFAVARFDNRDTGLSTQFSTAGVPNLFTRLTRPTAAAGYRLEDIADDGISLLDALRCRARGRRGPCRRCANTQRHLLGRRQRIVFATACFAAESPGPGLGDART